MVNKSLTDVYKSWIKFYDDSIQEYYDDFDIHFSVSDISDTEKFDNGCGFKEGTIYYLALFILENDGKTRKWNTIKEFCLHLTSSTINKQYYDAFEVECKCSDKFKTIKKGKINVTFFVRNNGCKILRFSFQSGLKIEFYNFKQRSIVGWQKNFQELKGTLMLRMEDESGCTPHILFFSNSEYEKKGLMRFNAFTNYITFHGIKYHGFRTNDDMGNYPEIHFSFDTTEDLLVFKDMLKRLFKKYFDEKNLYVDSYHLKYIKSDFLHLKLNTKIF